MFSGSSRNYIRNKVRKFKKPFFDISFNIIYNIMNNATSHLSFLLCKSSVSKYMIIVRSVTNEITKNIYIYIYIKLINHYHYRIVVYNFMHPKRWNIYSFLKGMCKDSLYIYVCVCIRVKKMYI